jgi:hypothetical protein
MTDDDKKQIESGLHSVPMTIILKLKKQLNFLLILNLILAIAFIFSVYDSIKIRDDYWEDHTQEIVETIDSYFESHEWQD